MDKELIEKNIKKAIRDKSTVEITYTSSVGNKAVRIISPWALGKTITEKNQIVGYQHQRGGHVGIAKFDLDNIEEITFVLKEGISFEPATVPARSFYEVILDGYFY